MRMLGPSMPYLAKIYYFLFFFMYQVNLSYPHLLDYLPLISHNDKSILPINLPKCFCKDSIDKMHEVLSYLSSNDFIKISLPFSSIRNYPLSSD